MKVDLTVVALKKKFLGLLYLNMKGKEKDMALFKNVNPFLIF